MAMADIEREWIDRFQENLGVIRKVAGWTTQELANELGVARQTISNLETGKSPMTKLQYLALRTVFNAEIAKREDRDLAKVIKTLVDDPMGENDSHPESARMNLRPDFHSEAGAQKNKEAGQPARHRISTAMQLLVLITGALASGTAAGLIAFFSMPGGKSGSR